MFSGRKHVFNTHLIQTNPSADVFVAGRVNSDAMLARIPLVCLREGSSASQKSGAGFGTVMTGLHVGCGFDMILSMPGVSPPLLLSEYMLYFVWAANCTEYRVDRFCSVPKEVFRNESLH